MELAPLQLRAAADYSFSFAETGEEKWESHGGGVEFGVLTRLKEFDWPFGQFKIFYNGSSGKISLPWGDIGNTSHTSIGAGVFLGSDLFRYGDFRVYLNGGYTMAVTTMSVEPNGFGKQLHPSGCPDFVAIIEKPESIKCYFKDMANFRMERSVSGELGAAYGPLFLAGLGEVSWIGHKEGEWMPGEVFRVGVKAGINF
jgi:hypothetical protein